uniref:Chromosome transmission fidelity protein 18 homolog n=1 Tax=Colobus angolensis palliatus TaxID=336983 RepID=A0A2K5I077_COLAP
MHMTASARRWGRGGAAALPGPGSQVDADLQPAGSLPHAPRIKRPRLQVVKRLNFRSEEMEELPLPDSPRIDVTPPPSPEDLAELWDHELGRRWSPSGRVPWLRVPWSLLRASDAAADVGLTRASAAARNPDFVHVTSTEGVRAYLVLRADPVATGVQSPLLHVPWRGGGQLDLLGVSFASLKEQVHGERRERLLQEAQRLSDTLLGSGEEEAAQPVGAPEEEPADGQDASTHCLWVDEFAPRHYTELLSDDFTNRCLLKWLKLWDLVVFGHERPSRKPRPSVEPARVSREAFRTRIEAATQMESVLGAGGKPNCLVIDEIDGAPVVGSLIILNRKGPQEAEPQGPAVPSGGGRRRRAEGALLMRPIICICNDQFAPSLRQLKQQAFLLHFPPTLPSRLVQRLQEGMRTDPGVLAALCEKTDNDIRACINTLQFLYSRGQREVSVRDVQATRVGLKDQRRGLFSVWQEVFQLPRAQRSSRHVSVLTWHGTPGDAGLVMPQDVGDAGLGRWDVLLLAWTLRGDFPWGSLRFYRVLHAAASAGEHEKVVQGLFDNFLRLRLRDSSLGAVCAALDWLAFDDLLAGAAHHSQSFQLLRYPPFLPVAFHVLFASGHTPRIIFPSSQQEAQNRMSQMRNLIQTLVSGIAPAMRSRATPQALLLDALCLLLDILAPKLRPVSTQLYSTREKQQLASLVGTMLAYSLTYRQERTPDGQYIYRLEPNVEELCRFPELPARKPLTYQAKQLIALPPPHQPERDFFGRVVVRSTAAPSAGVWGGCCGQDSVERLMGTAVGRSEVWFRFNEGVSNAVRRRLYIRDLL